MEDDEAILAALGGATPVTVEIRFAHTERAEIEKAIEAAKLEHGDRLTLGAIYAPRGSRGGRKATYRAYGTLTLYHLPQDGNIPT